VGRDSAGAEQDFGHEHTEDESADMGEERDTMATRLSDTWKPEVRLSTAELT
jgi:hypothetical protein